MAESKRFPRKVHPTAKEELAALYAALTAPPLPEDLDKWLAEVMGLRAAWHKALQREKRRKS